MAVNLAENAQANNIDQRLQLILAERTWYFDLTVLASPDQDIGRPIAVTQLQAGGQYIVSVRADIDGVTTRVGSSPRPSIEQQGKKIITSLEMGMEIVGYRHARIIDGSVKRFTPRTDAERDPPWEAQYSLFINEPAPTGEIKLVLRHINGGYENDLAVLKLNVLGAATIPPPATQLNLPLVGDPPDNTIFLWISREGDGLRPRSFFEQDQLGGEPIPRPPLPEQFASPTDYTTALRNALSTILDDNQGKLASWLGRILRVPGTPDDPPVNDLFVVLIDQVDSGLPWEQLKLTNTRPLGAVARVVRWIDECFEGAPVTFRVDKQVCTGEGFALVYRNAQVAESFKSILVSDLALDILESAEDLPLLLSGNEAVGLIYLNSEGMVFYGDEEVGDEQIRKWFPGAHQVRFDDLIGEIQHRPIVFVTAPFSGRTPVVGTGIRGLVRAALARVASGFIGLLGEVRPESTDAVVRRLIEEARQPNGVCPAELLQRMRQEAHQELADTTQPFPVRRQAQQRLLDLSLFVYYGNPFVHLRLQGPANQEGTH